MAQVGEKFGRLTVLSVGLEIVGARRRRVAVCRCECGATAHVQVANIGRRTNSCGCLYREKAARMNRSHGRTGAPEYIAWKAMLQRCYYRKGKAYKNYGGRGIIVHPEWRVSFEAFLAHVGPKPGPEFTLERKNNDGNYEPGNVAWATRLEQGNNTRRNRFIEFNGETKTLSQWSRDLHIPITTLWNKLNSCGGDLSQLP